MRLHTSLSPRAIALVVAVAGAACSAAVPTLPSSTTSRTGNGPDTTGSSGGGSRSGGGTTPGTTGDNGGGGDGGASSSGGDSSENLPCDVNSVLVSNCQQCHGSTPAYGATMPLVTYADLMANAPSGSGPVYKVVDQRIHSATAPMPPTPYPILSSTDQATIDNWVNAGAPASRDVCAAPPEDGGGAPVVDALPCTPDTLIRPTSPYAMADSGEQYICYGFDVTTTSKRQVIAMSPHLDNVSILHHILIFQSPDAVSGTPTPCGIGGSTSWTLYGGWAPGGKNMVLPPQAGFPESGTTHWVLQVHLSNAKGLMNQTDASGYDLCTTDQLRPNDAAVMAPGSINFSIPPRGSLDLNCSYTYPSSYPAIHVFTATPHMHLLGTSIGASVVPGGTGTPATIVNNPAWDFQTQLGYPASNDINPGDVIQTHCAWNNPGDTAVGFGEDTTDEMCFTFLAYYPALNEPLFSWVVPAAVGNCQ